LGAQAIVDALAHLVDGRATPVPQPLEGATYAKKILKEESDLDWSMPCAELERRVRAFRPAPGARTRIHGQPVKLWRARCVEKHGEPGTVLESGAEGVLVACGEGALLLTELQRPGGVRLPARDFLRGFAIERGERLGAPG